MRTRLGGRYRACEYIPIPAARPDGQHRPTRRVSAGYNVYESARGPHMTSRAMREDRRRSGARVSYELPVQRFPQPDDVTCGPTCLRKVYHFYGMDIPLEQIAREIDRNEDGGTLAVNLGISALHRGFH